MQTKQTAPAFDAVQLLPLKLQQMTAENWRSEKDIVGLSWTNLIRKGYKVTG